MKHIGLILVSLATCAWAETESDVAMTLTRILESQPPENRGELASDYLQQVRKPGHTYGFDFLVVIQGRGVSKDYWEVQSDFVHNAHVLWEDKVISNDGRKLVVERHLRTYESAIISSRNSSILRVPDVVSRLAGAYLTNLNNYKKANESTPQGRTSYRALTTRAFLDATQSTLLEPLKDGTIVLSREELKGWPAMEELKHRHISIGQFSEEAETVAAEVAGSKVRITFEAGKGVTAIEALNFEPAREGRKYRRVCNLITRSAFLQSRQLEPPKGAKQWSVPASLIGDVFDLDSVGVRSSGRFGVVLRSTEEAAVTNQTWVDCMKTQLTWDRRALLQRWFGPDYRVVQLDPRPGRNEIRFERVSKGMESSHCVIGVREATFVVTAQSHLIHAASVHGRVEVGDLVTRPWLKDTSFEAHPDVAVLFYEEDLGTNSKGE